MIVKGGIFFALKKETASTNSQKKELRSVGIPKLMNAFVLFNLQLDFGRSRIQTYVEKLEQIYNLPLLTTWSLSPSRAKALLNGLAE